MKIEKKQDGDALCIAVSGRLDTSTAPELEEELKASLDGITSLKLDFTDLDYISSAGLRVLLSTQKIMNNQGDFTITGVNDMVMDVFEVTGFSEILTIE